MGKTNQERLRRKLAQAYRNAGKVINDLGEVAQAFDKDHPEMAQLLQVVCVSQDMSQEMIEKFCVEAWGRVPDNWESWRNARQVDPVTPDAPIE